MFQNTVKKPWLIKKIVLPQHTDHAGVMWHGSYIAWLEEARIDALFKVGLSYKKLSDEGFELPVVALNINYKKSLSHGDEVLLKSWFRNDQGLRCSWETEFVSSSQKLFSSATVDLVLIKKGDSGVRLIRQRPNYISKAFRELHNGPT